MKDVLYVLGSVLVPSLCLLYLAQNWSQLASQSPFLLTVPLLWVVSVGTYWYVGLWFLYVDTRHTPVAVYLRKLQPKRAFDPRTLFKLVVNVLMGQVCISFPFALLQWYLSFNATAPRLLSPVLLLKNAAFGGSYNSSQLPSSSDRMGIVVGATLPSVLEVVIQIVFFTLLEELLFYYSHRVLHHPRLYGRVHKQHHEFTSPIALCAGYAHPIEAALSNVFPLWLGPLLAGSHIFTVLVWYVVATIGTQLHHCGYNIIPGSKSHDYHHESFDTNFGLLGVLDWLHATDREGRQAAKAAKHS